MTGSRTASTAGPLFRGAAVPTVGAVAVCAVVAAALAGAPGAVGALVGGALVVAFFGVDLLLLWVMGRRHAEVSMVVVLGGYVVKIVLLGLLVRPLAGSPSVDPTALAATAGVATVAWVTGLLVRFTRLPIPTVVPTPDDRDQPPGPT